MKHIVTALLATVLSLGGASSSMARDILPPFTGSACDVMIKSYLAKLGMPPKSVIQIQAVAERDDKLYFMLGPQMAAAAKTAKVTNLPDFPPVTDPKIVKTFLGESTNRGTWMVLTPGEGDIKKATVFIESRPGRCVMPYLQAIDFDAPDLPHYLLSS